MNFKLFKAISVGIVFAATAMVNIANAGLITAIGDVDAVNINSRAANVTLLDNLLGNNTNVLIIGSWANNSRVTGLTSHWSSLAGVSVSTSAVSNIASADLSGFDFLFYMQSAFALNTATVATQQTINNFISNSGDFLFVSQNLGNAARSDSYNTFLSGIGSSMNTSTSNCSGSSIFSSDALTSGVNNFIINGCNGVTGGTALVTNNGVVSVAYENVSQVPEPSTLAIFALSMIGLASRKFKKQS